MINTKKVIAIILLVLMLTAQLPLSTLAWTGPTHSDIISWSFEMMANDMGTSITNNATYQKLIQYMDVMRDAARDPDDFFSDVLREFISQDSFWASHFYNPYTGRTYTSSDSIVPNGTPHIHALYMAKKFIDKAVAQWERGYYEEGAYYLGYASHFITDACNPHHASLKTLADDTRNHGDFERYVEENRNDYKITNIDTDPAKRSQIYTSSLSDFPDIHAFLESNMNQYGKVGYDIYSEARYSSSAGGHWDNAAIASKAAAQKSLARVIYRFIQEVSLADKMIKVSISTADELTAGTDDDVFLCMETNDGKRKEFILDNLSYSSSERDLDQVQDFEQNSTTVSYFKFYDPQFNLSNVTKVWLRKDPLMPFNGDNWKPHTVYIYVNNTLVHSNTVNKWLTSETQTTTWNTPGGLVKAPGTALGNVKVTVATSDDTFAGTDNDIYFGIILKNGMKQEFYLDSSANDFEAGSRRTYSFDINDTHYQANDIDKFYFRKYSTVGQGGIEDDWKVEAIEVKFWNKTAYAKVLNKLIAGSDDCSYTWTATGIDIANPLIGFIDAKITTSNNWLSGTGDDVFFGVVYSDGTTTEFLCDNPGNDFNQGDVDTYSFCIPKRRAKVTALYVRKEAGGDDWRVYSVETKIDGAVVNNKIIDTLIKNNNPKYQWSVNGL